MKALSTVFRKIKNILKKIAIVFFAFLVIFFLFELYFRLFDPQSIVPRYVETASYGIRKNIANVKGRMIKDEYRHNFRTNSQGFRGQREYAIEKPQGTYRVAVLGDSVTLGHGVEDEETFSAVLEKNLSRTRPAEVINMGVSGYGTSEELIQLREVALKYDPDLVILGYFPNDPYNITVSKLFKVEEGKLTKDEEAYAPALYIRDRLYRIPGYSFLSQHSHFVNFVRRRFSKFFARKLARDSNIDTVQSVLSEETAALTAAVVDEFIRTVEEANIPLIILDIPYISSDGVVFSNLPVERLHMSERATLVDVRTEIYGDRAIEDISYKKDCHPKPLGHRIIAEWIENHILENSDK